MKEQHLKTFQEHLEEQYGKRGTPKREKYERGYEKFKLRVLAYQARRKKRLVSTPLAKILRKNIL